MPLRVALCHPVFWPEVRRGAERLVAELASGLAARGHAPRLVTAHAGRRTVTREAGVEIVRNPRWQPLEDRLTRRAYEPFLTQVPFTYLTLARGDDEVAQAFQPGDAVAVARWGERTGRPTVFAYMGIPHRASIANRRLRLASIVRATAGCTVTTALSAHARDAFHRWLGVEARVIPPPVDVDVFAPAAARTEHPTVVFAGDPAEPRKRFDLTARAWPIVRRSFPGATLLVNRRGLPQGSLPEGIVGVDLDDRAVLARTYASAWASVLPSWGEAFGLVLAEALAAGTPAVGARLHGIPEVLGDDPSSIGALFDGDAPGALADALSHALALVRDDPGVAGRCRARGLEFSTERCAERHEALYFEMLRASHG